MCAAENAKDASKTIPYSLITAFGTNAILAFVMAVTLIFCIGDIDKVLAETSITPFVVIFYNSTQSKAGTVVMVLPVIITFWAALVSQLATASRQLWAFARDGGVPWSPYLAPVRICDAPTLCCQKADHEAIRFMISTYLAERSGCLSSSPASYLSSTLAPSSASARLYR